MGGFCHNDRSVAQIEPQLTPHPPFRQLDLRATARLMKRRRHSAAVAPACAPTNCTRADRSHWCSTRKLASLLKRSQMPPEFGPECGEQPNFGGIWPAREPRAARGQLDLWREFSTRPFARLGNLLTSAFKLTCRLLSGAWHRPQSPLLRRLREVVALGASSEAAILQ
jgi:hypothetical protein